MPTTSLYGDILGAGAVVGGFEVVEQASSGGFATVYRGRHLTTGRTVALKVWHRALAADARLLERFYRETEVLARIEHDRVVTMVDHGELHDGRPYLVMEWLEGRTLAAEIAARGPLSEVEARAVLAELGDALAAVHTAGVIHRDLKAENIMAVPRDGWFESHLIDFGIARLMTRDAGGDGFSTQSTLGTPATMAPEQITGRAVDRRTDVYGLGQLLFFLVTGRLPFSGPDPVALEQMHLHAPPPLAAELAPVSEALDRIVQRALQKQPEQRYPSVAAMLAEVAEITGTTEGSPGMEPNEGPMAAPVLAMYLELTTAEESDAGIDALARLLDTAHEALALAGCEVVASVSASLFVVARLPADARQSRIQCRTVIDALLALERTAERSRMVRLGAYASMHACDPIPGAADFGPRGWRHGDDPRDRSGVWLERAVLAVIETDYRIADERDDRVRITARPLAGR